MRRSLLLFFFAVMSIGVKADVIADMLNRILPEGRDAKCFSWKVIKQEDCQQFTVSCDGRKVHVRGSDYVAIATGINWYLQHYAGVDISWNSPTAKLPSPLPKCEAETHVASVPLRYYLNFCTYSYSMAFWGWERWQQELDWMALHGINMPLAITGFECVWKDVLQRTYGYTPDEVNTFVCGSAFYGWFFMNNLTAWGGPQPESWYKQQQALARKVFRRMKDFGMSPVIPGYVGMLPKDFLSQADPDKVRGWEPKDIVDGGIWCSFTRPAFVNNTDRLKEFAAAYYRSVKRLYGDVLATHFYAIDPFHEGGVPAGVTDAKASVSAMWTALQTFDPEAVWVAQHWQTNPTEIVTHTIPRGRLVILDLHGDQYADTRCSGHHTTPSGENHDWVWGQVSNFGGNVGLFGRMDRLINCFYEARNNKSANQLVGIGALPEGIENNPMLYDLLYALPWTLTDYTRKTWIEDYVRMRYGFPAISNLSSPISNLSSLISNLNSVWSRLAAGIYNCPNDNQQGTTESVLLMRPDYTPRTVSSWAASTWYWDFADLRTALKEMLSVSEAMKDNDNYRYDLVDLTRQCLADKAKELLEEISASKSNSSLPSGRAGGEASRFLDLLLDQERLLSTRREFRLSTWTEAARTLGGSASEKGLYEKNARMLLTTWGDHDQCERGGLHDYANREWAGLLSSYYYPRWKAFFAANGQAQRWFEDFEWPFVNGTPAFGSFSDKPAGDEITIAKELYNKYLK